MDRLSRRAMPVDYLQTGAPRRNELTIADLFLILRRRRKQIAITTLTCFLLGVLVCILMTPRFEGRGVLEIQKTSADMLGLQSMMAGASDGPGDALNANLDLQTEAEILKSDELALKVIEDLHLDKTRDFQPKWSPLGWFIGLFATSGPPDVAGAKSGGFSPTSDEGLEGLCGALKSRACSWHSSDRDQVLAFGP